MKELDFIPFRAEGAKDTEVLFIAGNPRALREPYRFVQV